MVLIACPSTYPCCISGAVPVSCVAMTTGWVTRLGGVVLVGVGLFGGVGCSAGGDPAPTSTGGGDANTEVAACEAWDAAFNTTSKEPGALVKGANAAAAIAPDSPAGQLMAVFIARQGLPGDAPESPQDLINVQVRCEQVGAGFVYPSASA